MLPPCSMFRLRSQFSAFFVLRFSAAYFSASLLLCSPLLRSPSWAALPCSPALQAHACLLNFSHRRALLLHTPHPAAAATATATATAQPRWQGHLSLRAPGPCSPLPAAAGYGQRQQQQSGRQWLWLSVALCRASGLPRAHAVLCMLQTVACSSGALCSLNWAECVEVMEGAEG